MQYNYLSKHNNFKIMSEMTISLSNNLLPEQSVTYSFTISTLFPNQVDHNEELEPLHVFQSTTLEEHLNFLKRYHLEIDHVPQIKLLGDFHKNIEITMRVYSSTLFDKIKTYTHQQKLDYTILILKTYRALIKEYGFFLITHNHIKVDQHNNMALWINDDFKLNSPNILLASHTENPQLFTVCELIKLIKQFFTTNFFKYRKIQTFNQLSSYLQFIKKRNKIHKNCQVKARQQSQIKRRNTLSVRNLKNSQTHKERNDRFLRPVGSSSTLFGSNVTNWRRSRDKVPSESFLKCSSMSRIDVSKGSNESRKMKSEFDTTVVSSQLKNTRQIGYLQLSNIIQKSQKKSCVFGSNPEVQTENSIKRSFFMNRKTSASRLNPNFCPVQCKQQAEQVIQLKEQKATESQLQKNSLQIDLSRLLLSQINEDPQNETGGSELKRRQQLVEQFETLLCS